MSEPARNLLPNPLLHEGLLSPTGWGVTVPAGSRVVWQRTPAGEAHAVLLANGGDGWSGLTSHRVSATGGEWFTVAAWMRALPGTHATEADRLFVRFFTHGRFVGQNGPALTKLTDRWQVVLGSLQTPATADAVDVSVQVWSHAKVQVAWLGLVRGRHAAVGKLLPPPPPATTWQDITTPQNLPPDDDNNGLADRLEAFLGIRPEEHAGSTRRTRPKTTSFQTPTGYREDNDLKVDIVLVAGNAEQKIRSWAVLGYEPHVMVGFRAGPSYLDGREDGRKHRDEVQTDAQGTLFTCGPGSYYMVPTENRRRIFRRYFAEAVKRGARAVCPEEPEFFSRAGYSDAFKREWQAVYGEPWNDPASSVAARFRAARLKVILERRLLQACYEGGRSVDPRVPRFVLTHSPLNYATWGIVFGHHDLLATGDVDALVAQVWTGTARTPVTYEGKRRERTFENAFLEYASCVGLTRGLPVDLWFLMDPLEDNPNRSMTDYHDNYLRTLAAALMFPSVTHFETMPWPTRIFGRVSADYATEICSVINVLSDMQGQQGAEWDAGSSGIGTFLADSAMWQRAAPHAGDMNDFYGLALPLLMRGVPVAVPCLDRAAEPGYLDRYRALLVSYDLMKPMQPAINEALARWVRKGGCLLLFGGADPYNAVPEWWREKGFAGPQDHLLSLCGFEVSHRQVIRGVVADHQWRVVAKTDYTGRNLENLTTEVIDLTPFLKEGAALIRCEDSLKGDGWGALIQRLTARGIRNGKPVVIDVRPNTPQEEALLARDGNSAVNPDGFRFCDRDSFVVYRFAFDPGTRATVSLEIGNQYLVEAAPAPRTLEQRFGATSQPPALGAATVTLSPGEPLVTYSGSGARGLYTSASGDFLSERTVGKGSVLFCGAPPWRFSRSRETAEELRALVRYALGKTPGPPYEEHNYLKLRRGRYVIAKTFDTELTVSGPCVDVLEATLPVLPSVTLKPGRVAVLYDARPDMADGPRLLFSSSCVEWKAERNDRLRLIVSGARGVRGTCRVFTAGRKVRSLRAVAADGRAVPVHTIPEGNTLLLRYDNEPFGIAIDLTWSGGGE